VGGVGSCPPPPPPAPDDKGPWHGNGKRREEEPIYKVQAEQDAAWRSGEFFLFAVWWRTRGSHSPSPCAIAADGGRGDERDEVFQPGKKGGRGRLLP
jgi:hypothetical protein